MNSGILEESCVLRGTYSFDTFVAGSAHKLAVAACREIVESPAAVFNPLVLSGGAAVGKTHLLHAIGNQIKAQHPDRHVAYIRSDSVVKRLEATADAGALASLKQQFNGCDVLLFDDVHLVPTHGPSGELLRAIVQEADAAQRQVVLAGDWSGQALLAAKAAWVAPYPLGIAVEMQAAGFTTRLSIVRRRAHELGLDVDEGTLELIAKCVRNNTRNLEGALVKVAAFETLAGQLSHAALSNLMPRMAHELAYGLDDLLVLVSAYYGLVPEDLTGRSSDRAVRQARLMVIYLAREWTSSSFPRIAQAFGNRNHGTVMRMYREAKQLFEGPLFQAELAKFREALNAH